MAHSAKRIATVAAVAVLLVFAFYLGTTGLSPRASADAIWTASEALQQNIPADASEAERQFANIYNQVAPSVVSINVVARQAGRTSGFEIPDEMALGTGTGFVIDTDGHIVTNNHVVEGATRIEVNFFDGTIVRGEVVGLDPDSDLAVIRVDLPAEDLQPIMFGDSGSLFIGQEVVAIGSPFGQRWTMTTGIVSALDRTIEGLTGFSIGSVIQTDAAINPGNSGGPLVNLQGQVIGVNSQIMSRTRSNSGIGFAVPSNLTQRVAAALIETGSVSYSYLGISGRAITLSDMEALGLPNDARGVVVEYVEPRGPASQAGLRMPRNPVTVDSFPVNTSVDIITAIDGQPVTDMPVLIAYLAENTQPGQTITLTVVRDGTEQVELSLTLGARPSLN